MWPIWKQERDSYSGMHLFFLDTSSWLEGHGTMLSSRHVFEATYSCALSAITAVKTCSVSREVGFGKSESPVQDAVCMRQLQGSQVIAFVWLLLWVLVLSDKSEMVKSVMLLCFRFTQLSRLWRKIVPSAELTHTVGLFRPASGKIVSAFIYEIPIIEAQILWNSGWSP